MYERKCSDPNPRQPTVGQSLRKAWPSPVTGPQAAVMLCAQRRVRKETALRLQEGAPCKTLKYRWARGGSGSETSWMIMKLEAGPFSKTQGKWRRSGDAKGIEVSCMCDQLHTRKINIRHHSQVQNKKRKEWKASRDGWRREGWRGREELYSRSIKIMYYAKNS